MDLWGTSLAKLCKTMGVKPHPGTMVMVTVKPYLQYFFRSIQSLFFSICLFYLTVNDSFYLSTYHISVKQESETPFPCATSSKKNIRQQPCHQQKTNKVTFFHHLRNPNQMIASWWFQPIWKICSSNWMISPGRVEHKNCLKLETTTNQMRP